MNNRVYKPLVAILAVLVFSANVGAAEISINGDFETGDLTGWDDFSGAGGSATITSDNVSGGNFALSLNASGPTVTALIKNANVGIGLVAPGDELTVSFDARGSFGIGGVLFAEVFSEIAGGGVSSSVLLGGAPLALDADPSVWTSFSFTTTAGPDVSGGMTLQLAAICGAVADCFADVFIDNVSITTAAPVPVPAAIWLMGSALGLLGLRRRKAA